MRWEGSERLGKNARARICIRPSRQLLCCTVRSTVGSKMAVTRIIGSVCWSWELRRVERRRRRRRRRRRGGRGRGGGSGAGGRGRVGGGVGLFGE